MKPVDQFPGGADIPSLAALAIFRVALLVQVLTPSCQIFFKKLMLPDFKCE